MHCIASKEMDTKKESMITIQSINLITSDPTVRAGRPCLVGTGIRVTDIVIAQLFHRRTADEIAADYEIPLAQVYAALAYYYEHKDTLDADLRQQLATARTLKEKSDGAAALLLSR